MTMHVQRLAGLLLALTAAACGAKEHDHAGHDHGHDHEGHDHDHDHDHAGHTPHHGIVVALHGPDGKKVGYAELKLHDDKGDLELWLAKDEKFQSPLELPLAQTITVHFPQKTVTLAVRNKKLNEDEDGVPTAHDGKTNYFIFPGASGQDASWLVGKSFKVQVHISFALAGKNHTTAPFELTPHSH